MFHEITRAWFRDRFGSPTEPQRRGWPAIASGEHTLIAAPTGSGKTLAAFLTSIDALLVRALDGALRDEVYTVYVSPLKALSNDIARNLEAPLAEIQARAAAVGHPLPPLRAAVRTGDTPQSARQGMLRRPPHILVTTPESLYLILTSPKSREMLRTARTVIVDEIHAVARDKRGSHLSLTLERLDDLAAAPLQRLGLSATLRPLATIAAFLVGAGSATESGSPRCRVIDAGHLRDLDLAIEVPPAPLSAVCSHETWAEIYALLTAHIRARRSTLVFVNTRRLAERVAHSLELELGEGSVASHHGSLSREIRASAEARLKDGSLKAMVATASLEMGIDIGFIDLVCQIGSPRSIAAFLQRVGRSGHSLGREPCGRLFPLSRDELIECLALVRSVRAGRLDRLEVPHAPLDILAQQLVATVACEESCDEDRLYALCRRAWPFRGLERRDFDAVLAMVSEGVAPGKSPRGAYLHRDRIHGKVRPRRSARIAALTSGGAIPEMADYRVVTADDRTYVGTVHEDFAVEAMGGDIFLLGNTSWRIEHVRGGEVVVADARGAPANVPFWIGEAPGRTAELSAAVSDLRTEIASSLETEGGGAAVAQAVAEAVERLAREGGVSPAGAEQAVRYIQAQHAALGVVPTQRRIVFERFFDDSGGMQLVVHSPYGSRINRAWGLALRKRFCRSFNFELQASADDDGIVLSLGPQHSFPLEDMFHLVRRDHAREILVQAVLAVPFFATRWRWNLNRALAVLRQRGGKRVPPPLQRLQSDDLLAAVFPQQTACLEHITGDIEVPDHPLVKQTMNDCLHEAMDLDAWLALLEALERQEIEVVGRDSREPSPFSYERLNANPYAFLDDAPLEERRARAVATRRTLELEEMRELARLDPEVIRRVEEEAWPLVRDAEELHDALETTVVLPESEQPEAWRGWLEALIAEGRAARARVGRGRSERRFSIAAESWPLVRAAYGEASVEPAVALPAALDVEREGHEGVVAIVRGRLECRGIETAGGLASSLALPERLVAAALERLEGEGFALRGRWRGPAAGGGAGEEWCERRLLARMHRLTLEGLRKQIEPASPEEFVRFLTRFTHLHPEHQLRALEGLWVLIDQLAGFEAPAGAWETEILPLRVHGYDGAWLDELVRSGQAAWGRLHRPASDAAGERPARRRGPGALTRTVPLALFPREDLAWIAPPRSEAANGSREEAAGGDLPPGGSGAARRILERLPTLGAPFLTDIAHATGLLRSQAEAALGELAARGLVTADSFAAIRPFLRAGGRPRRRREPLPAGGEGEGRRGPRIGPAQRSFSRREPALPSGPGSARWSRLAPPSEIVPPGERSEYWAWLLLRRWGIVFRDLLEREISAPRWGELVRVYRRLEARGDVRGGRFVRGVGGEQYALEEAITLLRKVRSEPGSEAGGKEEWSVVCGADPLNLTGVVLHGERVPAVASDRLALRDGRLVASSRAGEVRFHDELPGEVRERLRATLLQDGETRVALASASS
jgi:ATP-dependent Lhr-like helicase